MEFDVVKFIINKEDLRIAQKEGTQIKVQKTITKATTDINIDEVMLKIIHRLIINKIA